MGNITSQIKEEKNFPSEEYDDFGVMRQKEIKYAGTKLRLVMKAIKISDHKNSTQVVENKKKFNKILSEITNKMNVKKGA